MSLAPNPSATAATTTAATTAAARLASPAAVPGARATAFTLRHRAHGWSDLLTVGAPILARTGDTTAWLDLDANASTVNSSSATVTVPPAATVDWAGLYWGGDVGPDPHDAGEIVVNVNNGEYQAVRANALTTVVAPSGAVGFQAYADVTALLRSYGAHQKPQSVPVWVANLAVPYGTGRVGGWALTMVYSYPDGPHLKFAPTYRRISVYDAVLAAGRSQPQAIHLGGLDVEPVDGGLPNGLADEPQSQISMAILASGQSVAVGSVTIEDQPVGSAGDASVTSAPGLGYELSHSSLPPGTIPVGDDTVAATVTTRQDAFVAAVLAVSTQQTVRIDLSIRSAITPTTVPVGGTATLTLTVHNDADLPASGVAVATRLPAGLTVTHAVPGFDSSSGVWTPGLLAPHGSTQLVLAVRVDRAGVLAGSAELSASTLPDVDSTPGDQLASDDDFAEISLVGAAMASASTKAPLAAFLPGGGLWGPVLAAVFFGVGLFLLGALILLILLIRARSESD